MVSSLHVSQRKQMTSIETWPSQLESNDSETMKEVQASHAPDGRKVDVNPILHAIDSILLCPKTTIPDALNGTREGKATLEETSLADSVDPLRSAAPIIDALSHQLISYTKVSITTENGIKRPLMTCMCPAGDEHARAILLLKTVKSYSWDAKVLLTVAAFAVNYGEFFLLAQSEAKNSCLSQSMALLKQLREFTEGDTSSQAKTETPERSAPLERLAHRRTPSPLAFGKPLLENKNKSLCKTLVKEDKGKSIAVMEPARQLKVAEANPRRTAQCYDLALTAADKPPVHYTASPGKHEQTKALVVRHSLGAQGEAASNDCEQRENLFHTRCFVAKKMCTLIIDNGSCTNCASTMLLHPKFRLSTVKHPKPYLLHWKIKIGELKVTQQVVVPFSIGNYKDEVLCDVVPMQASHILLGRPWQDDREAIHDTRSNRYRLRKDGQKFILAPLTQAQASEDQQWNSKSFAEFENMKKIERERGELSVQKKERIGEQNNPHEKSEHGKRANKKNTRTKKASMGKEREKNNTHEKSEHAESGNYKSKLKQLEELLKLIMGVTKCIVDLNHQSTTSANDPVVTNAVAHFPKAAYWTILSVVTCASHVSFSPSGFQESTTESVLEKISTLTAQGKMIQSLMTHQLSICKEQIQEKDNKEYLKLVSISTTPQEDNLVFLKALFCHEDGRQYLVDSNNTQIQIEELKGRHVLVLVSSLDVSNEEMRTLEGLYKESQKKGLKYQVVWVPVVDSWGIEERQKFQNWKSKLPWYMVADPSKIKPGVIKYLKKKWQFHNKMIVVPIDPKGVEQSLNALDMLWIWGNEAFPFTKEREETLWGTQNWTLKLLLGSFERTTLDWMKEGKAAYVSYYGGEDIDWIKEFTSAAKEAITENIPGNDLQMVYVGKSNSMKHVQKVIDTIKAERLSNYFNNPTAIWFFWTRLESILYLKMLSGKNLKNDPIMREVTALLSYDSGDKGWALFCKGPTDLVLGRGDGALKSMKEFAKWRGDVQDGNYLAAAKDYMEKWAPKPQCGRIILTGSSRREIPSKEREK